MNPRSTYKTLFWLLLGAALFVVVGDRMVALAAILTGVMISYIAHQQLISGLFRITMDTADAIRREQEKVSKHGRTFTEGVVEGIKLTKYDDIFEIEPKGKDSVVISRRMEVAPKEYHSVPIYVVTRSGIKILGKAVPEPQSAAGQQIRLL